ncbi:MAG: transglutaminase family protein [Bacteroidota bacterium]
MIFNLTHSTEYTYSAQVSHGHNIGILRPRVAQGQELLDFEVQILPEPSEQSERIDFFGNHITRFSLQTPHKILKVVTKSRIKRNFGAFHQAYQTDACQKVTLSVALQSLQRLDPDILEARQYLLESIFIRRANEEIRQYAATSFHPERSIFDATYELMQRIYTDFDFVPGFTTISTPLVEVMEHRKGVCQDFAQIAIACIRAVGLPARYVSGYIETLPPEGQEKLVGADASHAWFSLFIPDFGWVDFDPTNNQLPIDQHIVVGWGRDYYDVPPLKGVVYGSGNSKLKVAVDITREE